MEQAPLDHQALLPNEAPFACFAIGFFTSHSHVDIPSHESVTLNQQIGIPLLLADSRRNRLQLSETLALLPGLRIACRQTPITLRIR